MNIESISTATVTDFFEAGILKSIEDLYHLKDYKKKIVAMDGYGEKSFNNIIKGIDKSYALQAGRELRVLVKPEEIDDLKSHKIAREIKEKIESSMQYPGTIKVTVIRETRVQEEAK